MVDENNQVERGEGSWASMWRVLVEAWPKIKTPLQLVLSQLIAWVLHKWLG